MLDKHVSQKTKSQAKRPAPGPEGIDAAILVGGLIARAKRAQKIVDRYDQAGTDLLVAAAGWAIMEPSRNRALAELAVADTGLGNVADKIEKNHRKTLGLLRDLKGAKSVGIIAEHEESGIIEIARPVGVVAAITPSTNPGATPANKIINALKGRNAIILAPSPKGWSTCAKLLEFVHAELDKLGAPRDLVQLLPAPVTKGTTQELMRQADLVVATGSQANIRAAYASGTPAFGVGAGNVASIVDRSADLARAARQIAKSKTFDNATSCSSENSLVLHDQIHDAMLDALSQNGGVHLNTAERESLQAVFFPQGKLSPELIAKDAPTIAAKAGLEGERFRSARFLMVSEDGFGPTHPFSGEKLAPVLAIYRAKDFAEAVGIVERIYAYQGAGHSVGLHTRDEVQATELGLRLAVSRVIVNQAHCVATGGSFDNGLPFSLSMGCGTWGRNSFSDNMNYRHYLNITRISRVIPERVPETADIFRDYFRRIGAPSGKPRSGAA
ncbi:MAG: aldehyde dehydrogenase family protein [Hyphomicrobiales bacterium]|nr:aldehyde dehydrogenase family protein [Hyphomicrobiales bacterium]